ncbi:hypothetical protein [Planctomycetes bacterium TBK1r]|uniref:Uncharacterized protein n=1 Tax=Stieleria magnilauensis TaxID=2527963 RepID=A0ABX5XLD5_9BACT|nr:hypothetical protein TBK1r_17300 [Planctomycetes bacterium TBK1r]
MPPTVTPTPLQRKITGGARIRRRPIASAPRPLAVGTGAIARDHNDSIAGGATATTANRPGVAPPTLFRLKTLRHPTRAEQRLATLQVRRRSPADGRPGTADQNEVILRIDPPQPAGTVQSADRNAPVNAPVNASPKPPARPKDLFPDHTGDLIASLSQWSLRLDRREAELDRRERELNQRLRLLRQHQFAD